MVPRVSALSHFRCCGDAVRPRNAPRSENVTLHSLVHDPPSIHTHKLTEKLASFSITTRADDLPSATLESARQLILDTIGVSLLASTHKIGRLISAQAAELGGPVQTASVFGAGNLKVAPVF